MDQTAVPYSPDREWFTLAITVTTTAPPKPQEKLAEKKPGPEPPPSAKKPESGEGETPKANGPGKSGTPTAQSKPQPTAEPPPKTFYYSFVVFPAGEYTIGSIGDEPDRNRSETRHPVNLTRPVAVLDREITFEELIAFSSNYTGFMQRFEAKPADAGFGADWYDAVGFCRWLGKQSGFSEADQCYASPESLDKEQYPREPNPEANWAPRTGRSSWLAGVFGCRRNRSGSWPVAQELGRRTVSEAK